MKYITKQAPPHELISWTHAPTINKENKQVTWGYDDMPSPVRQVVKAKLIEEQGGICSYTGRRITADTSHIEHLKPQARCLAHEDTDYRNLLAAYPAWNAPQQCSYGAHAKKSWFDEQLFVHPLREDCERRFQYKLNGKIAPSADTDQGAKETIRHLCLDHRELASMREAAITAALFEKQLTKLQAERLMVAIEERDSNGLFRPFCFAIKQACIKYLKRFDKK